MSRIEERTLFYEIMRHYTKILHRLTHKHISINGVENVPKNEPLIFAANHQNALLDPFAVVVNTNFQVVYLARADIFKNRLAARFLKACKIAPVYRMRDGKESLDKNDEVFRNSVQILENNGILALFPEASHVGMKSMVSHKKAIPRIVFKAAELTDYKLDIKIVPIGINYSHYYFFRRNLTVNFGKPLSTADYYEQLKSEGDVKTANALRDDLFERIEKLCVHVPDKKVYDLYEQSFEMMRMPALEKIGLKKSDKYFYEAEKYLTERITEELEKIDEEETAAYKKAAIDYKKLKEKHKISESALIKGDLCFLEGIKVVLLSLASLPLWIYGALTNGWLFYLTRYVYRSKIKDRQFWSTFSIGLNWLLAPIWILVHFFLAKAIIDNTWLALGLVLFSIPSGILAWEVGQMLQRSVQRIKNKRMRQKKAKWVLSLENNRKRLFDFYKKALH